MEYEIQEDEQVSTAVVFATSKVSGEEPCSIPSLTDVVDTDALDTLFAAKQTGEPRSGGRVLFVYNECRVTVENGEYVTVEKLKNNL